MNVITPHRTFPATILPAAPHRTPTEPIAGIAASSDAEAVGAWLSQYAQSACTFANCLKEAERFLLWIGRENKVLADVRHEDIMRYRTFLANPPAEWVNKNARPRSDAAWRPFRGPLSPASIRQAEIVLAGLFRWLTDARYLSMTPFALSKRQRDTRSRTVENFLTRAQLQWVFDTVDAEPSDGDQRRAARDRWLTRLLYLTGLRVTEAAEHTMGDLIRRESPKGTRWALAVIGKGGKAREIPATPALLDALRTFRTAWGLSPLPVHGETMPLLPSLRGGGHLTRTGVYRALDRIFERAAACCEDAHDAAKIRLASTHWMRHTRGTHLIADDASLKTVQELLGHASLTTTSRYIHDELDRVQDDMEKAEATAAARH